MGNGTAAAIGADVDTVARAFVDARRAGRSIVTFPGRRPDNLADAYLIQDRAIAIGGRSVGGWKVGRIWAPDDSKLGSNRLTGPIFADAVVEASRGESPVMPVFADGFAAGEAEFMVRLAPPVDGVLPQTEADTLRWVDEVRIGIEVASSPYPGINADGPCVTISDHGNNAGLVLGREIPREAWAALRAIEIVASIDGQEVGRKTAADMLDGPLGAVRFIVAHLASRGIAAETGTWISTGAVTGVHPIRPGQTFSADFDGFGQVSCSIGAY